MATTVYVKPAPGCRVRQPERRSRVMPAEGAFVPRDSYYERLIISGDLVVSPKPAPAAAPASPAPAPPPPVPAATAPKAKP